MRNTAVLEPEVDVMHGANTVRTRLKPGTIVATIRMSLTEQLGIPAGTPALVDGTPATDNLEVPPRTQVVEFLQPSGQKG